MRGLSKCLGYFSVLDFVFNILVKLKWRSYNFCFVSDNHRRGNAVQLLDCIFVLDRDLPPNNIFTFLTRCTAIAFTIKLNEKHSFLYMSPIWEAL